MQSLQQKLASRLQQYMPDLRKQVRHQISKQLARTNKSLLAQKTNQLRQLYTQRIQRQAEEIREKLNRELRDIKGQIEREKQKIGQIGSRVLEDGEKKSIVEDTVQGILEDQAMLGEIRDRLYHNVEENVFKQMEAKLQLQLQEFQNNQCNSYQRQRGQWQKQKYQHWKLECQRDIQALAQQHKQLQEKKSLIMQSLSIKKAERQNMLKHQNSLIQANNQISFLKNQIKLLS